MCKGSRLAWLRSRMSNIRLAYRIIRNMSRWTRNDEKRINRFIMRSDGITRERVEKKEKKERHETTTDAVGVKGAAERSVR